MTLVITSATTELDIITILQVETVSDVLIDNMYACSLKILMCNTRRVYRQSPVHQRRHGRAYQLVRSVFIQDVIKEYDLSVITMALVIPRCLSTMLALL